MLTKVEVRNDQGGLLTLDLDDEIGIVVQDIRGLDPVKAAITSSNYATRDGVAYQNAQRGERNIVMQLGLEPDYATETVDDLRERVYEFFMTKAQVWMRFYKVSGLVVDAMGRVESCEHAIFTQDPAMDISVLCSDPDFIETGSELVEGETTPDEDEILIEYPGSVSTGFRFRLLVDRSITELTLYHRAPNDDLRILEFSAAMVAGDILDISTVAGSQSATLTHLGTPSSVLYGVSTQSKWSELSKGSNYFRAYTEGDPIPFELEYTPKYGAI